MTKVLDDEPMPTGDAPDPFALVGKELAGKYRVIREIGQGGMGVVYEVVHKHLNTRYAIKFIKIYGIKDKETFLARFLREAQVGARIKHPGIAQVYDLEWHTDGMTPYLVMEYLEGRSFGDRLREAKRIEWQEAFDVVLRACEPLAAAHAIGVTHRDLKPDNLFLCSDGILKMLDFGIARFADAGRLTRTGMMMGTPLYMSREQVSCAKDLDGRADIYSLGVVLYHAISGRYIFEASNQMELMVKLASETPIDIQRHVPSLPAHAASVIRKAIAAERDARYATLDDLKAAIAASLRAAGGALRASPTERTLEEVPDATSAPTVPGRSAVPQPIEAEVSSRRNLVQAETPSSNGKRHSGTGVALKVAVAAVVLGLAGAAVWRWQARTRAPEPPAARLPEPAPAPVQATPPAQAQAAPTPLPSAPSVPPAAGRVRIVTIPPGATVSMDGKDIGKAPVELTGKPDEMKTIRLSAEGFAPKDEQVMLTVEGGVAEIALKPMRAATEHGYLHITANPYAQATIDGKPAGETPIPRYAVKPGAHVVELSGPTGTSPKRISIKVDPGKITPVHADF